MEIIKYSIILLSLIIAVVGHEIMHGLVAHYYGDNTAKKAGRLSLNPIKHIDLVGTIIFPIFLFLSQKLAGINNPILFGWAKPVPINIFEIVNKNSYLQVVWVALAGITFNLLMALIATTLIDFMFPNLMAYGVFDNILLFFLLYFAYINLILFVFNLIPIPPLDGAEALKYISLHFKWLNIAKFINLLEPYGMLIILFLMLTHLLDPILKLPSYLLSILL